MLHSVVSRREESDDWDVLGWRLEQLHGLLGCPCGAQEAVEDKQARSGRSPPSAATDLLCGQMAR